MGLRFLCGLTSRTALYAFGCCCVVSGLQAKTQTNALPADATSTYVPTLTFDVASIRESAPSDSYMVSFVNPPHSSLVRLTNSSFANLISIAFGVRWSRIEGMPSWGFSTLYMLEAKSDSAVDDKLAKLSDEEAKLEKEHMLQVLLADRFQLKVEWRTREGTNYSLVVARGGPKMSTKLQPPTKEQVARFDGARVPPLYQTGCGPIGCEYVAHGATMTMLAQALDGQMGTNVVDKTGLTDKYDFTLRYSGSVPGTEGRDPEAWSPLIIALPEQLGLKLVPSKGPVEVIVIDHIERPSPN